MKYVPALMKREDGKNKIMNFSEIFQTIHYVELEEVDKILSKCVSFNSNVTIKRTEYKLPNIMTGYNLPLIREVRSISGPVTQPNDEGDIKLISSRRYGQLIKSKTYKYDKKKYCWYDDGYLWFPDLEWDAVQIEAIFLEDIDYLNEESCGYCTPRQEQLFPVPEYLFPEIEKFVWDDLTLSLKIPQDPVDDKININR